MQKEKLESLWVSRDFYGRNNLHFVLANIKGTWFLFKVNSVSWPRKKVTEKFRKTVVLRSMSSETIMKGDQIKQIGETAFIHKDTVLKLIKEIENEIALNS